MFCSSPADISFLTTHGFIPIYGTYRNRLLTIAKEIFRRMKVSSRLTPDQLDVAFQLEVALKASSVFTDIIADLLTKTKFPGPKDPFWPEYFAEPVANFVVDTEWQGIAD